MMPDYEQSESAFLQGMRQMIYSKAERVLGLSRIWRDVKYNFARFYEVTDDEKWEALFREYYSLIAQVESPRQYYELLLRFVNSLCDGHTYILVPDEIRPAYSVNFATSYIDGKHILTTVPNASSFLIGAEILGINGVPCKRILKKLFIRSHGMKIQLRAFYTVCWDTSSGPLSRTAQSSQQIMAI